MLGNELEFRQYLKKTSGLILTTTDLSQGAFHLLELAGPKELLLTGLNGKAKASSRNYPRDPCVIYTQDTQELM